MVDVKLENNTAKVLGEFGSAMERALYAIGTTAQGDIVKYMGEADFTGNDIVDSGRLRASISFVTPEKASGRNKSTIKAGTKGAELASDTDALDQNIKESDTVILGTNVEYADKVNNGTSKQKARKFMEKGIEPNWDKYQKMAKDIFGGKL